MFYILSCDYVEQKTLNQKILKNCIKKGALISLTFDILVKLSLGLYNEQFFRKKTPKSNFQFINDIIN